jgi:hypothetical protein
MTGTEAKPHLDPHSVPDMAAAAREALADWRKARDGTAAERRAARMLAWAVGRLDDLGGLPE